MATTTNYGTWYNHTGYNLTPGADILDAINGGDSPWQQRMEESGALERIESDWRDAIQAALPDGVWLTGNEFIGPHDSDPTFTDEIADFDIKAAIENIDLEKIIEKHDVDSTIPTITVADIRSLLNSQAHGMVLYIKNGPDDEGGDLELDVWADAHVTHQAIVITRTDALDMLGDEPDNDTIAEALASLQETVDSVAASLLS